MRLFRQQRRLDPAKEARITEAQRVLDELQAAIDRAMAIAPPGSGELATLTTHRINWLYQCRAKVAAARDAFRAGNGPEADDLLRRAVTRAQQGINDLDEGIKKTQAFHGEEGER